MKRFASQVRVFDGAVDIVRRRARLGPVAIVSGALRNEVDFGLEKMGVTDDVAFVVAAEACTACKPDPEGYLLALRSLEARGKARARAVVVEDSIAGVQAGKAAGLRVVAVAHSYSAEALATAGADAVAKSIADVTDAMLDNG
jgi:beta-phosphoglucomutase-like phosphatase (HAD superfamily)